MFDPASSRCEWTVLESKWLASFAIESIASTGKVINASFSTFEPSLSEADLIFDLNQSGESKNVENLERDGSKVSTGYGK